MFFSPSLSISIHIGIYIYIYITYQKCLYCHYGGRPLLFWLSGAVFPRCYYAWTATTRERVRQRETERERERDREWERKKERERERERDRARERARERERGGGSFGFGGNDLIRGLLDKHEMNQQHVGFWEVTAVMA